MDNYDPFCVTHIRMFVDRLEYRDDNVFCQLLVPSRQGKDHVSRLVVIYPVTNLLQNEREHLEVDRSLRNLSK